MNTRTFTARAIIPSFRYEDAPGAIEFLSRAFGFEKHAVYAGPSGRIVHAQLALGSNFIMLGSASDDMSWPVRTPRQVGAATGGTYIVLESDEDVDAHCERARAAGATIIREPESPDYGGRNYGAQDPEGYLWSFGSYRPESATV
ncbi:MAG: VOC family protein [Candidatus Eremiobacteraeota bacterium]|nr:VOC family protein [Candidatus Eremiobacteraeota bacterium]MBC5802865.1 VOC family protein [Candidatus Eremiobacteraeota bacterium]MBC5820788.1 VOC family protein [Candidatus Eremiobacteraeota bacterium]